MRTCTGGTSMSQAFAYGFRTLAANPQIKPSMLDLERLFFDRDWRETLLPQVSDPFLRSYWSNQVDRTSTRQFELTFGGALRRMAMLVQDPRVRNILVQPRSAMAWDGVLAERKIVLANLDKADTALGAAGSRLLGSILVTQFWQAVLRRPADVRPPFFAVFDEFQEFLDTGRDMAAFFERSRSYGVGLTVATQNPSHPRLRPILDSVLMNTRTHVVFGGLRAQVRHFTDEMAPTFSKQQLDGLPAYHMAITTLVDNRPARPFEAAVAPIPVGDRAMAERVRAECRRQVGQPRTQIEELVAERYGEPPQDATRETGDTTPRPAMPPPGSNRDQRQGECRGAARRSGSQPARGRMTEAPPIRMSLRMMLREVARKPARMPFRMAKAVEANVWAVQRLAAEPDGDSRTFRILRRL